MKHILLLSTGGTIASRPGADGLEIEVHHDPAHARSDGPQALVPEVFDKLMRKLTYIKDAVDRADREIR